MKVIISIPAYNEEKTLRNTIVEIKNVMSASKYAYKIHVQDDGSIDNTLNIAKKYADYTHSNVINRGLAYTFQEEVKNCLKLGADIIVHTDADGQYDPKYIPQLIKKIEEGYALVIGSRFYGKNRYKGSYMKNLGNVIFSKTLSWMLGAKISDTTSGFRAFNSKVAHSTLIINKFTYTQEQIIRAVKNNFKITEIPIKGRITRKSRLFKNSFDYAYKAWLNIFRIYRDYDPLKFFGRIGFFFIFLSCLFFLYLVYTLVIRGLGFLDRALPTLMVIIFLFSIGLQIVLFGFLADKR